MIDRLSNLVNRNRSAAKISQVLCSTGYPTMSKDFSIPASAPGQDYEINLEEHKLNECFITRVCPPSMRGP